MDSIGRSCQVLSVAVELADRLGRQIETYGSEGWGVRIRTAQPPITAVAHIHPGPISPGGARWNEQKKRGVLLSWEYQTLVICTPRFAVCQADCSRATDLGENEAGQKAFDLHVYSIIRPARHSQESATWSAAGEVDAAHQAPGLY
jgi:hypothetical protein